VRAINRPPPPQWKESKQSGRCVCASVYFIFQLPSMDFPTRDVHPPRKRVSLSFSLSDGEIKCVVCAVHARERTKCECFPGVVVNVSKRRRREAVGSNKKQ
jgi:hypothetical protein